MRILIITQYYAPEPPLRPAMLAPSLVERGHEVTVVTGFPCYPEGRIYPGYRVMKWQWEWLDGVRVLRLPVYADHSQSALRRMAYYSSIAAAACLAVPTLDGRYDAAFVYSPPPTLGVPAMLGKLLRGTPYVIDVQDLWPESLPAAGINASGPLMHAVDHFGRLVYCQAAAVTVISPGFRRALVRKGIVPEMIHVVPNWADESIYRPVQRDERLARDLGLADRFNVVYGGNLGLAQGLRSIVEAAELLRDLPDVQLVLVGDGVERPELERLAEEKRLTNVLFLGRRKAEEMPGIYALADALLLHLRRDPLFAITVPSKTIAYLASGRPVLAAVEGDTAEIVTGSDAGLACPPEDPTALARLVREFRDMPLAQRERFGSNARRLFADQYTREKLVSRFEELFQDIAARRAS